MAQITNTIQPDSDFDQFFKLLSKVLPVHYRDLLRDEHDKFREKFFYLSSSQRQRFLDFLRDRPEVFLSDFLRDRPEEVFPSGTTSLRVNFIFNLLKMFATENLFIVDKYPPLKDFKADSSMRCFVVWGPRPRPDVGYSLPILVDLLEASDGTPSGHYNGAAGTSDPSGRNPHVVLPIDGLPSDRTLNKLVDKGKPELAGDDPTWFKTLLKINGGLIITLITNSTGNNPQSLLTEIMEAFTAFCAVVGFSVSLAGLYLSTKKPKKLPFGCDPEVSTQNMGIVGGLATAFGFTAGVLLLLPNNLFRWITMGVAFAALLIPILYKLLRKFSGAN